MAPVFTRQVGGYLHPQPRGAIAVDLRHRRLYFFWDGKLYGEYPVAIGRPETPTPQGDFRILEKEINPGGILGSRWMRFYKGYGIHGTNQPELIGQAVSRGCIRMHNHHIEAIYPLVSIRTPVHIREVLSSPSWPPKEPPSFSPGSRRFSSYSQGGQPPG